MFTPRIPAAPNFAVLMWAPWLRATEVMMSPGCVRANRTAILATVPLMSLGSAWRTRKSLRARATTRSSTSSTKTLPW